MAFGLLCIPIIVIPGPSVLFTIGRSLALGKTGGLLTVVGSIFAACVAILLIAFGLGLLLNRFPLVYTIVKIAGALYLMYLGIQAIRHRKAETDAATGNPKKQSAWVTIWQGFAVGITNAKGILFLVAILPLFVDTKIGNYPVQILLLGAVFVVMAIISDSAWALVAGVARDWFAKSPKRIEVFGILGGCLMIILGLILLILEH